jgi:serine phosphatase RsbU (regulator of sigma subunit)
VGGDFYDVLPLGSHGLFACLGDVSGKGVPAALVSSTASDSDFTFRGIDDPSALVRAADRFYGVAAVHETAQREL